MPLGGSAGANPIHMCGAQDSPAAVDVKETARSGMTSRENQMKLPCDAGKTFHSPRLLTRGRQTSIIGPRMSFMDACKWQRPAKEFS
jgi:hypothetical protein